MNRGQVCNPVIEGCVPLYTIEAISFLFRGSAVFVLPRVAVEYAQPSTSDGASAGFREPESKQSTVLIFPSVPLGVLQSHNVECKVQQKHTYFNFVIVYI